MPSWSSLKIPFLFISTLRSLIMGFIILDFSTSGNDGYWYIVARIQTFITLDSRTDVFLCLFLLFDILVLIVN